MEMMVVVEILQQPEGLEREITFEGVRRTCFLLEKANITSRRVSNLIMMLRKGTILFDLICI